MHADRRVHCFALSLLVAASLVSPALRAASWPPLDPADRTATASAIEPDASVEILARETTIDDSDPNGTIAHHYARLKVFNQAGVNRLAKIEIAYDRNLTTVSGVEARTTKLDGTVLELKRAEVFDREVVRAGNVRRHVKAFAPPGLEPGAIVEYRYQLTYEGRPMMTPMLLQSDAPVRSVRYRFRPFTLIRGLNMQLLYLNHPQQKPKQGNDGYYEFSATNLRAFKEEPMQAPSVHLASSLVLYYTYELARNPDEFWARQSDRLLQETKSKTRPTKPIVAEARRVVGSVTNPDEQLRLLHDYCRTKIQNRSSDASGLTREQRRKLKANDNADDTLKNASGSREEINALFVALARGLGLDARMAQANNRTKFMFSPRVPVPFAFGYRVAAVRVDGQWRFYDPGARYLPPGMLDWRHSDTSALIANEKTAVIEPVKGAPADRTFRRQTAELTLTEDGTLEGQVSLAFAGYFEAAEKNDLDAATSDKIEQHFRAELEPHLKGVEISELTVAHVADPLTPLEVKFHLRVPEFAERTGSRLFIQPNVFRRGVKALFESPQRETAILFPHRYRETDEIAITLPAGATLEAGSAPGGLDLGPVGNYEVNISWSASSRVIRLQRDFALNLIAFGADKYPLLKRLFEVIQERDDHTLTFRLAGSDGDGSASPGETAPEKTP